MGKAKIKRSAGGVRYGVFYKKVTEDGYPRQIVVRGNVRNFGADFTYCTDILFEKMNALLVKTIPTENTNASLRNFYGKIKIKDVGSVAQAALDGVAYTGKTGEPVKIFIGKGTSSIAQRAFNSYGISYDNASNAVIYCEESEKPEGWSSGWNMVYTSSSVTAYLAVTWGVTEAQFDAL